MTSMAKFKGTKLWTHAELVERAGRWLRYSAHTEMNRMGEPRVTRCGVVLTEPQGGLENPDAIGWFNGGRASILIECKNRRRDFLADKQKWHRRAGEKSGMGMFRFYMAVPDVIYLSDLMNDLDGGKWGLLIVHGRSVKTLKLSYDFECNQRGEKQLLWSALRAAQAAEKKRTSK